ncbi:thioredoxin domain-containing protein [uncultured Psychroserpens sp.]|uniref:thioredoxin domain-containing protein n=1 Tax=uncultured Psychroserpens sp. TaxID=255436 RepID=UPI002621CEF6|nr:thioredoxin domain-containing protein [uncultured Psychroserpens sp.]
MQNSLAFLTQELLKRHAISIDKKELYFQIESHPSYPSLHAITGVLDHFNIDNIALDIPKTEETLAQLPKTFLAQINTNDGLEFVIAVNEGLHYQLIKSSKQKITVSIKDFLQLFTGIIVGVEKSEFIVEDTQANLMFNQILIVLSIITVIGIFFMIKPPILTLSFLVISLVGLVLSIAIKKQEHGQETVLGQAFCSNESETKNCNAVLTSKGAFLSKNYKLSDLSIIYFIGLSLTTFSLILLNQTLTVPYLISVATLPITIYSIYYQSFVLKTWCFLCLSIVGILWILSVFIFVDSTSVAIDSSLKIPVVLGAFNFIITLIIYNIISPKLNELKALNRTKVDFHKFKRNFTLFNTLLEKSKPINTTITHDFSGIIMGNPEAKLEIIIVTNPFCGYCKSVHASIENIYRKYGKNVMLQIRFNANPSEQDHKSTKVVIRLLELYHVNGLESCMIAMNSIYNNPNEISWLKEFGACSNAEYYSAILEKQYKWCVDNQINFTPAILINGKSYPNDYSRDDLILFIEELHENCCIEHADLQLTT